MAFDNRRPQDKSVLLIAGFMLIGIGIIAYFKPVIYFKGAIFDLTGYNILGGTVFIIIGVVYIGFYFRKSRREQSAEDESPEFVICKNCKTPQYSKDLVNGRCAKCTGTVVSLDSFYHRHPKSSSFKK